MKLNFFPLITEIGNVFFAVKNEETQVREGNIIAQHITRYYDKDNQTYEWNIELTIECEGGKTYKVDAKECYATLNNFRQNQPIEPREYNIAKIGVNPDGSYFTIENGQVVRRKPDIKTIEIISSGSTYSYSSPDISKDTPIYLKFDVAEQMCRTEWTDKDGGEHTRDGILRLIMLDEDQKEALKALKEAYKKCIEMGMDIGYDVPHEALYCWNVRKVKDAYVAYEVDADEGGTDALFMSKEVVQNFETGISPTYIGDDYGLYIVREDEEDKEDE